MTRFVFAFALLPACGGGDNVGSDASTDAAADATLDAAQDSTTDAATDAAPGTPTTLATSISFPWCIASDATNVYYCSASEIWMAPINGGTPTMLAKNPNQANNLAIAVGPSMLYVLDYSGATAKVPLPGGGWTWNSTGGGGSVGFGVVFDGSYLYWASSSTGTVVRVPVDGGAPATIVTGQGSTVQIAGDGASLFWANGGSSGAIVAKALPSGAPTPLTTASNAQRLTSDANNVYYVAAGSSGWLALLSVPRTGGSPKELFGYDSGLPLGYGPGALASDGANVYFAVSNGKIYKAELSGGANAIATTAQVSAVAVDATNVYWIEGDAISKGTLEKMPKP